MLKLRKKFVSSSGFDIIKAGERILCLVPTTDFYSILTGFPWSIADIHVKSETSTKRCGTSCRKCTKNFPLLKRHLNFILREKSATKYTTLKLRISFDFQPVYQKRLQMPFSYVLNLIYRIKIWEINPKKSILYTYWRHKNPKKFKLLG